MAIASIDVAINGAESKSHTPCLSRSTLKSHCAEKRVFHVYSSLRCSMLFRIPETISIAPILPFPLENFILQIPVHAFFVL